VGVCPFFVTQPSFEGFWPDRSCPAFFIIGAADKPRRAGKPQAFPPEVGFIRWLCGAKRQATGGCLSAAPLSRARSVRDNRDREKPHGSPLPHHRADGSRTRRFGRLSRPVESPSAEAAQGFSARKPEPHLYPLQAHVHPVGCSHGLHWTTITPLFQVPLGTPFGPSVGSLAPRRRLPYYALC
jgi:hypothetical protein